MIDLFFPNKKKYILINTQNENIYFLKKKFLKIQKLFIC